MILISLMLAGLAWGDDYAPAVATKKIEQFVVKRDREGAIQWLNGGIEKTKSRPKDQAFLIEKLRAVAQIFFTDEGQKSYESASSLYFFSHREARLKADKALSVEPGNARILFLLGLLDLKDGKCSSAGERFAQLSKWTYPDSQRAYLKDLISYCDGTETAIAEFKGKAIDFPLKDFFAGVRAVTDGTIPAAETHLEAALEKDASFPETYYWLWKADPTRVELGKKYVQFCATPDPKMLRKYRDFPFVCAKVKEMPSFEVDDDP